MTDNISSDDIDAAQRAEYIRKYNQTDDREEQRHIENQVLAETVWKSRSLMRVHSHCPKSK